MKRILTFLTIAVTLTVAIQSCKKKGPDAVKGCMNNTSVNYNSAATEDDGSCQYAETSQRYFIMDITGTWCPPCGSYGIPGFSHAIRTIGHEKLLALSVHSNDIMSSTIGNELLNYPQYKSNSVPRVAGGNSLIFPSGVYNDSVATASKIKQSSDAFTSKATVVNSYVGKTVNGNTVTLDVKAKFFSSASGDYYVTGYVIEDGIVALQQLYPSGTNPTQVHDHVLRGGFTSSAFGESLVSGSVESGKVISKTLTTTLTSSWKTANLSYAVVIWKKDGSGVYSFENATVIK